MRRSGQASDAGGPGFTQRFGRRGGGRLRGAASAKSFCRKSLIAGREPASICGSRLFGMGLFFEGRPQIRRRSSMAEHPICNRKVAGSSPIAGSRNGSLERGQVKGGFSELGQVAEWLMAADCKSAALRATEVRILPCPPIRRSEEQGRNCGSNS